MLATSVLGALGVVVFSSWPSIAQFAGGGTQAVEVVNEAVVRVASGTVALDSESLDTITNATALGNCTYTGGNPTATISTTAANIPASPMASRTAITIWNHSNAPANALLCNAGGTATTTAAVRIESGHQFRKWEGLGGGVLISCRCITGTCTYGIEEERCYQ